MKITEAQDRLFDLDPTGREGLEGLRARCASCERCVLSQTRTKSVFGEGNASRPKICFVGEAPGEAEDRSGRPFVGSAGVILDRMISAMGLKREDLYLMNSVSCRPPGNRSPTKEEVAACHEYLVGQIRAIRPVIIIALGGTALRALIGGRKKIEEARGKWHDFLGIPVMPTLHPATVAAVHEAKAVMEIRQLVWSDLQLVLQRLDFLQ